MTVIARAPCRVDLAGGTLDIWPLGVFEPGRRTVNVAIDVFVEVRATGREKGFRVEQGGESHTARDWQGLRAEAGTALVGVVCEHLGVAGAELVISSGSPRGGGLGGSSALTVAMLAALGEIIGRPRPTPERLAAEARDLEAGLMKLPTGIQDHAPALLGGVVVVEHQVGGSVSRRLEVDLVGLAESLLVVYTGQSHFSAGNNWAIIRRALDGDREMAALLGQIAAAAVAAEQALLDGDIEALGLAVGRDWQARRQLAAEVTTPLIDAMLAAAAEAGAWGGKVCGAGGGGCVVVVAPHQRRAEVARRLEALGGTILPARPTTLGLSVSRA